MKKTILTALAVTLLPFLGRAANTPPTIAAIGNQTVPVDHPALVVLEVGDAETALPDLQLSLTSSNPALIRDENVVFHYFSFDGHWYITVVPTFGLTGSATATVTVSDGTNSTSANFVLTVSAPPPGAARFANTTAITIPDVDAATPYPSTINVTGMSGTITNLTLTLSKIHHQYIKDVHMLLVGPTGKGMVVFSRISRDAVTNVTATLMDAAPFLLPDQFDLWSEEFKPTDLGTTNGTFSDNNFPAPAPAGPYGPVSFAGSFNGLPANGTWSLYVYDEHAPSHGAIEGGWSLMVATTGAGGGSTPTISNIANQSTTMNTPTAAIPFTINDADTPVGNLTLSGNSSNPTLVPISNIVFGGSGTSRTVTVTPATGQTGTATITVTVSDGTSSANDTFVLTVSAGTGSTPTISNIANQSTTVNTPTAAISFTISDADTPVGNLTLSGNSSNPTLVPVNNIVFGGSGSNRTVKVSPAAGQTGSATITVTVSDGTSNASDTFVLTVSAPPAVVRVETAADGSGIVVPAQNINPNSSVTVFAIVRDASGNFVTNVAASAWSLVNVTGGVVSGDLVPAANLKSATFTGHSAGSARIHVASGTLTAIDSGTLTVLTNTPIPPPGTNSFTPVAGTFNGLFFDPNDVQNSSSGCFSLTMTPAGTYKATIISKGRKHAVKGKFDSNGQAVNTIPRVGGSPLTVNWQGNLSDSNYLAGSVSDGTFVAPLEGGRNVFTAGNPAPQAGRYTLSIGGIENAINSPAGNGFGTVVVGADGVVSFKGRLADDTVASQKVALSKNGEWPVCISLDKGQGILIGWLQFGDDGANDISGTLRWIKAGLPMSRLYKPGFSVNSEVIGSRFVAPIGTAKVLQITDGVVVLSGGNLPDSSNSVTFGPGSRLVNNGPNSLRMTFTPASGLFRGTFAEAGTTRIFQIKGVVLQRQNYGSGYGPGSDQSGLVVFQAAP